MASTLNQTPSANRFHIAVFGLRNAGKSTLVNALTGQSLAIVSEVAGTTTDPVSKAMEILPLGPCLITDTAGLDDVGELGALRVKKSLDVLATTDLAIWVGEADENEGDEKRRFREECGRRGIATVEYHRGDTVEGLKEKIASMKLMDDTPGLLDGLVSSGDRVICVCPIDSSAPKGRLILPQVQVLRACLDLHATCEVCQPEELKECLRARMPEADRRTLVVTDSQAFAAVADALRQSSSLQPPTSDLTSFSVLFARQKGDIAAFERGLEAIRSLGDGDTVLVAEGCTHHRQCNDIGTTKIPKALKKLSGRDLNFVFASGNSFDLPLTSDHRPSLVVHCGGCMLTRREVLRRIELCREAGVPIVNYGLLLAAAAGIDIHTLKR